MSGHITRRNICYHMDIKNNIKQILGTVKQKITFNTAAHEEKKSLEVDVNIPEHADRTETYFYRKTREEALKHPPNFTIRQEPGRCYICRRTELELGESLQTHHLIERCMAEAPIDWDLVALDFPDFDWENFDPSDPYTFIDDMTTQGILLCRDCHIGKDMGVHGTTMPWWIVRRYLKSGYEYSKYDVIPERDKKYDK